MSVGTIPIEELFGANAVLDINAETFTISLSDLSADVFLDVQPNSISALELLAAIVKKAHNRILISNNEPTLLANTDVSVIAPASKNGIDRTLFSFTFGFYRDYVNPDFDVNEPTS